MLACRNDLVTLENFSYGDTPTEEAVHDIDEGTTCGGKEIEVSVYELSGRHDVRDLVVKTLLTYFELEGILQSTGPKYTEYKFQPQRPSLEFFSNSITERAQFLRSVLKFARKGKTWLTIDVAAASERLMQPRERIIAALTILTNAETSYCKLPECDLVTKYSNVLLTWRVWSIRYRKSLRMREEQDIARLRRVISLAESPGCYTENLLKYFGEEHDKCGHCGRCQGKPQQVLPLSTGAVISTADRRSC